MHVIFWQIAVIATIVGSYRLADWIRAPAFSSMKCATMAALAWSVFSLWELVFPPLLVIQLCVIWGTWALLRYMGKQARHIMRLRELLRAEGGVQPGQVEEALQAGRITVIDGSEHLEVLRRALDESGTSLCILSGWVSSALVDDDFVGRLKGALGRGVEVRLGYGWKSPEGTQRRSKWEDRARASLDEVASWSARNGHGALRLVDFAARPGDHGSHVKLLAWDRRYAVCGSNNWLSNRRFRNTERSWLISDHALATTEHDYAMDLLETRHRQAS